MDLSIQKVPAMMHSSEAEVASYSEPPPFLDCFFEL
jgi:hypothetical protein